MPTTQRTATVILGIGAMIALFLPFPALGAMSSANYTITAAVVSGGGGHMEAAQYQTNSTLGQPSPLTETADPALSVFYDLYPGFWFAWVVPACECNLDHDSACDISDYFMFDQDWGRTDCNDPGTEPCACDLDGDGDCDMSDYFMFGQDWGRTDCP